jgi:methyltransferase (TIGR00027 family)
MRALRAETLRLPLAVVVACVALGRRVFSNRKRKLPFAVSDSSRSIAALRAIETEKGEDALFADPFAGALAGEAALARVRGRGLTGDNGRIAIRTKFFDDAVQDALSDGTENKSWQVVLLGAGLDTRAWRLKAARPASVVFEVDVPEVLDGKERLLHRAPLTLAEKYASVKCDLAVPRRRKRGWLALLEQAGFDRTKKTVWVLEGLLYYLAPSVVQDVLIGTFSVSAPGSRLVASVVNHSSLTRATKRGATGAKASWASWSDEPERDFLKTGWCTKTVAQPGDGVANFGRWRGEPPVPRETSQLETGGGYDPVSRTFYVMCQVNEGGERGAHWDSDR